MFHDQYVERKRLLDQNPENQQILLKFDNETVTNRHTVQWGFWTGIRVASVVFSCFLVSIDKKGCYTSQNGI